MFSKNLKYFRLKNELSKKELAERTHVSSMAISNYESGSRKPSMEIMKALAKELGVKISDFLAVRDENLVFRHGEFRKNVSLSMTKQEYICEFVEEYLSRFMSVVEILGGDVLPEAPAHHSLALSNDDEDNAQRMRKHMGLALDGPIENLIGILENRGVLVMYCDVNYDNFSGMNGLVNDRPYIVLNSHMTPERNRSNIVHELAHVMFVWPKEMDDRVIEKRATAIGGAFLFPKADAIRELGTKRMSVSKDMRLTAKEYGISMMLLVTRAKVCSVLSEKAANNFYIQASQMGWRKNEPTRISSEKPTLFAQLVFRAVSEGDVSAQKGAELLRISYDDVLAECCFSEE